MRMMAIPRVNEFQTQVSDTRKELKSDNIEKTTFKSEYDKKIETTEKVDSKPSNQNETKKVSEPC